MERPMSQTNSHSGDKPITYRYEDYQIEVLPYFLYEVSIYRIAPMRANMLSTRYYTSDKLLEVKEVEVIKRFKDFNIERFITLLGAPKSFIEENNLPMYELKTNRKKPTKKK